MICGRRAVPVLSFFFLSGTGAIAASLIVSAAVLFMVGAATTLFTGSGVFSAGLRQLTIGLAAAAITYAIGRTLGVITGA